MITSSVLNLATRVAIIDFWAGELEHLLVVIQALEVLQRQMVSARDAFVEEQNRRLPRLAAYRARLGARASQENPVTGRTVAELRDYVVRAFQRFVVRCFEAGLLPKEKVLDLEGRLQLHFRC
jgi:hypothetical protein